jgi:hypothetical protein
LRLCSPRSVNSNSDLASSCTISQPPCNYARRRNIGPPA